VHADICDEVCAVMVASAKQIVVGNDMHEGVMLGVFYAAMMYLLAKKPVAPSHGSGH
tara:strand:- start:4337 stop:4507 length:171 start_codon:yes stop_codon:yes gene_type:complete